VQCVLIRRIAEDLNMNLSIQIIDTMREPNGLAMSSRNVYLSAKERDAASILYRSLCVAKKMYEENLSGDVKLKLHAQVVKSAVMDMLKSEPMVTEIQYVSVDSKDTMAPLQEIGSDGTIVSIACKIGTVRLIDNIML